MLYEEHYSNSWALLVGINDYQHASPLVHACNDAEGVKQALVKTCRFEENNIFLLLNDDATRASIMETYHALAKRAKPNDRVVFFFAGHGHTEQSQRGETGFLLPADGATDDLSTLIRWDELTRNADLIPAKHMLFVMDACYGGLAVTRYARPGSKRFLKDMLTRYSRQVLAAGKANEVVADSGGPRGDHSIFTGHLLEALDGAASNPENVLTALGVNAYVYDRVANDPNSNQTPHYGWLDGDGDMVLLPEMPIQQQGDNKANNILVGIPPTLTVPEQAEQPASLETRVKEYLSDPKYRIALDDLVTKNIKETLDEFNDTNFPMDTPNVSAEDFVERLHRYESCMANLRLIVALICRWGGEHHRSILQRVLARVGEVHKAAGGKVIWIGLRWHSVNLLLYTGGIAALESNNYANVLSLLTTPIQEPGNSGKNIPLIVPTAKGSIEVSRSGIWKHVPGHERNYEPQSEYAFKETQPMVEDLFFLGNSYEALFDRFEMLMSLTYAHLESDGKQTPDGWGPPGRFWWKYASIGTTTNPFSQLRLEAASQRDRWEPLKAGFFNGSYERFEAVAASHETLLQQLGWH